MPLPRGNRFFSPSVSRNRDPILAVLRRVLPESGLVLEIGSGTGEHATYFAENLPHLVWQPSDPDPTCRDSIAGWVTEAAAANLKPPLDLDVCREPWPVAAADAVCAINLVHIAPWEACVGLMNGAGRILPAGGVLYLYGAYRVEGRHTAPSNAAFDEALRHHDRRWGVRDLEAVVDAATLEGFELAETVAMPSNNLSVVFRKQ